MAGLLRTSSETSSASASLLNLSSLSVCLLMTVITGCTVPEPTPEQIVESDFTLGDKSRDMLLQACQQEIQERVDRADSYDYVEGSDIFDKDSEDGRYRVFFKFYADMTDTADMTETSVDKTLFNAYCKFNEQGESVGSGLKSTSP